MGNTFINGAMRAGAQKVVAIDLQGDGVLDFYTEEGQPVIVPRIFYLKSIPVGIPPNGTIDAAGNLTLVAALSFVKPHAWMYFPAGAVNGGLAGMYYVRMTTTSVGTVYTNYVNSAVNEFVPFIPETPVLAVGSNVAYTQTTGQVDTVRKIMPGNSLGKDGKLRFSYHYSNNNSAGNKVLRVKYGNPVFDITSSGQTTGTQGAAISSLQNQGVTNLQFSLNSNNGDVGTGGARPQSAVDTTQPFPIFVTLQIANAATDNLFLTSLMIEVFPQS